MSGRRIYLALVSASLLALPTALIGAPEFAPNPRQSFEGFAALNPPRADVPIGALWIDGFGPTGPEASKDNLETVRSINSLTIDKNLQLALTLGLFDLIGIDPKLRDHYTARFTDLTIVRVKDISKLAGPRGEPRIVEALKAGSVTISSDNGFGLNARTTGFDMRDATGSTTNDRSRLYSIEARDMYVAIHVATPELIASDERELRLSKDRRSARLDDYVLLIGQEKCKDMTSDRCRPSVGVGKLNSYGIEQSQPDITVASDFTARLKLPVPLADEHGGLFDTVLVRMSANCDGKTESCGRDPELFARYAGTRLTDAKNVKPRGW